MAASTISHNTPAAGSISWTAFNIAYNGKGYSIPAGNTAARFVWWEYRNGTPAVMAGDVLPDLTADDTLLFLNKGGIGQLLPETSIIDGSLIVEESILASAIGADQINGGHIQADAVDTEHLAANSVTAEQLSVGTVSANLVANGSFEDFDDSGSIIGWELSAMTNGLVQPVTGVASSGAVAIQFDGQATAANLRLRQVADKLIPVSSASGRRWYVSARMGAGTATSKGAYIRVNWYDGNRAFLSSVDVLTDGALSTTFSVYEGQVTPPSTARFMGLEIMLLNPDVVTKMYVDEATVYDVLVSARIGDGQIATPHLKADAIDGMVITGATIQTAKTGARIVLDQTGLKGWDANNINYLKADSSGLSVTGTLTANGTGYDYERLNNVGYPTAIPMDMVVGGAAGGVGLIGTQQWPPPSPAKQGSPIPGLAIKPTGVDMYAYAQVVSRDGLEMQLSSGIKQSTVKIENGTDSAYPNYVTISPTITTFSKPVRAPKYYVNGQDLSSGEVQVWESSGSMPNRTIPVPRLGTMTWNVAKGTSSTIANPDNAAPGTLKIISDGVFDISFSYGQNGGSTDDRSFIEIKKIGNDRLLGRSSFSRMEDSVVCTVTGVKLVKDDVLAFEVYQDSGATRDYTSQVRISRVAAPQPTANWESGNKSVSGSLSVTGPIAATGVVSGKHRRWEGTTRNFWVAGNASWDSGPVTRTDDPYKTTDAAMCTAGPYAGSITFNEAGYYSVSLFVVPTSVPGDGWTALNYAPSASAGVERLAQCGNRLNVVHETYLSLVPTYFPAGSYIRSQLYYSQAHTVDAFWKVVKVAV